MPLEVPIVKVTGDEDARRQEGEDQHEAPSEAAISWLVRVHG